MVKKTPRSEAKNCLSEYLRLAEEKEIIILRNGKPAGVLVGFASEDDWFDYRLEKDSSFLAASPRPARAWRKAWVRGWRICRRRGETCDARFRRTR